LPAHGTIVLEPLSRAHVRRAAAQRPAARPADHALPERAWIFHALRATLPADVLFDFGQSTLTAQGKQQLDQLIASAKGKTFDSVNLIGYTDPLGSAALNNQLSLARANAVKAYLQANGFPDKPITTEGRGSQDAIVQLSDCPASGDAQITCLARDRRVVVNFISTQGSTSK
jgi:outer membrane protein OmpA-like peptidoglycan-associated protein